MLSGFGGALRLFRDQQEAFDLIEAEERPIFVTGAAGTGKSQLLRFLRDFGKDAARTEVVAFTGAAAVNVEGRTIHNLVLNSKAWSQSIQVYAPLRGDREIKKKSLEELTELKLLIVDEVSMVRADMIDAIDRALRLAKGNQSPFGGVRLVMFGDLRQLPPFVVKHELVNRETRFLNGYESSDSPYFFMAHVFSLVPIVRVELTIQKRVVGDDAQPFIDALNGLRRSAPAPEAIDFINSQSRIPPDPEAPFLFSKRKPAAMHNLVKISALPGTPKTYRAKFRKFEQDEFDEHAAERAGDDFPAPPALELRVGAKVMVVANLDVAEGLVNGATGRVEAMLDGAVEVRLDRTGKHHVLEPWSFDWKGLSLDTDVVSGDSVGQRKGLRKTKIIGSYLQIPLVLAWGITIHKAQGATLTEAAIDFGSEFHSPGQAYVAVSRLTSIDGLSRIGELGPWHFPSYLEHVERFESAQKDLPRSQAPLKAIVQKLVPWRPFEDIESLVDNHLELIPQVRDFYRFSHRRRMQYLRDQGLMTPSQYLARLYESEPENTVYLCRNIDRAMRNKPLAYSIDVVGSEFEARLRDEFELLPSDQTRFEEWYGTEWKAEARAQLGSGRDVPIDSIPEYEIESIRFFSPIADWEVVRLPDPASKERLWEYRHPIYDDPRDYPKFGSLALLLVDLREDWQGLGGIGVHIFGSLDATRIEQFAPYLGVGPTFPGQILLNGEPLFNSSSGPYGMEPKDPTLRRLSRSPVEKFFLGESVLISIGAYSGANGRVLEIRDLDFGQYLIVQPDGHPGHITIRSQYVRRMG